MVFVREYNEHDALHVEECIVALQAFEQTLDPNRVDGQSIAVRYREHLLGECRRSQGRLFVAESEERVVGFVCVLTHEGEAELLEATPGYAYITDLIVLAPYRGRGIGRALMRRAEDYTYAMGATVIKVDVLAANRNARASYERLGYQEHEIRLQKRLGYTKGSAA